MGIDGKIVYGGTVCMYSLSSKKSYNYAEGEQLVVRQAHMPQRTASSDYIYTKCL